MIAIRNQPYPQFGLDLNVFEDKLEEYDINEGVYPEVAAARKPCRVLARLVVRGEYQDADRVYSELTKLGITIEPRFLYERMAQHALRAPSLRSPATNGQRLADFLKWWSLIPPASHPKARGMSFPNISRAIFSSSAIPDIPLAIHFTLVGAAKGYGSFLAGQAVSFLARYAPPSVTLTFLGQLREADAQYFRSVVYGGTRDVSLRRYGAMYGLAIRVHCIAGRVNAAVDVFQDAMAHGISITRFTREFLLDYLKSSGNADRLESVVDVLKDKVTRLSPQSATVRSAAARFATPRSATPRSATKRPTTTNIVGDRLVTVPSAPIHPVTLALAPAADSSLATILRYLKNAFTKGEDIPTSLLARFFHSYKKIGRTTGLTLLRRRAYRTSRRPQTIGQWALAEMLYQQTQSNPRGVFLAFAHHFHAVGLPARAAKFMSKLSKRPRLLKAGRPDWEPVESVVSPQYTLNAKMWAGSHHTALVWRAVVQIADDLEQLQAFYQELLDQVALAREPEGVTDAGKYLPNPLQRAFDSDIVHLDYIQPVPCPVQFDEVHFTIFIDAFVSLRSASKATEVLQDMFRLGIQPGGEAFMKLAAGFAQEGDLEKLNYLLTDMENAPEKTAHVPGVVHFTRPNAITYTAVIHQLLKRRAYQPALEVAKRLYIKGGYVSGTNTVTDAALRRLLRKVETQPKEG
ncbi:hypothetical protein EUX98_g2122 [Antrodiella citrinella]|uniref:Pentacotripeptide-repeat region of PRORP domain-containing protein n=1 Tax=Antrodiella citrinella TaxID=2447956 RepID=A0A4S4N255_9APHY|nr:hypothetical protein EUX98_g2122 [Antrodiella citrinella]